jgi:hypothetical protein
VAWESSCFLSVTWHGESLYRLEVWGVGVLLLLGGFFFSAKCGSCISAKFLIYGGHTVCILPLLAILDPQIFSLKINVYLSTVLSVLYEALPILLIKYVVSGIKVFKASLGLIYLCLSHITIFNQNIRPFHFKQMGKKLVFSMETY